MLIYWVRVLIHWERVNSVQNCSLIEDVHLPSGARCHLHLQLLPNSVCFNRKGSGDTAWISRLPRAFHGCLSVNP